ncbi:MAG: hypothetical protein ABL895_19335 [Cyclobacteriaceae bacterium]
MDSKEVQRKGISIDRLRKYKGLENLTKEEAQRAVHAIEKLTEFLFNFYENEEIIPYENKPPD